MHLYVSVQRSQFHVRYRQLRLPLLTGAGGMCGAQSTGLFLSHMHQKWLWGIAPASFTTRLQRVLKLRMRLTTGLPFIGLGKVVLGGFFKAKNPTAETNTKVSH